MLKWLKNKKGYVSIEVIIISGLIIGSGVLSLSNITHYGNKINDNAMNYVQSAQDMKYLY